jgi:cell division protein ZapA (FtsZ GTPase activity inhibitor)
MPITTNQVFEALARRCRGDRELLALMAQGFLDSVRGTFATLGAGIRHGQWPRVKRLVQALQVTAGSCGADVLCELAQGVAALAAQGDAAGVALRLPVLDEGFRCLRAALAEVCANRLQSAGENLVAAPRAPHPAPRALQCPGRGPAPGATAGMDLAARVPITAGGAARASGSRARPRPPRQRAPEILLEEMTHPLTLAGITTPRQVCLDGSTGLDELLLYADATTPQDGAKLYSREGYRAGEIALAYVDPAGAILHDGEPCGALRELTMLFPLSEGELAELAAVRERRVTARAGVESEPDWHLAEMSEPAGDGQLARPQSGLAPGPLPPRTPRSTAKRTPGSGAGRIATRPCTAPQEPEEPPVPGRIRKAKVTVCGQRYTLWSAEPPKSLRRAAAYVHATFRRLCRQRPPLPPFRAAVLVAVIVASELLKERVAARQLQDRAAQCDRRPPVQRSRPGNSSTRAARRLSRM